MFAQLWYLVVLGGPVVAVLLCFSLVASTVVGVKLWQFWGLRASSSAKPEQALKLIESGERSSAKILTQRQRNPRIVLISKTLHLLDHTSLSIDEVRDEASRIARFHINQLQSYLRILEVIAMLAPLLGLFGTVLGMISAFQAMEGAGSQVNPAILSGGIWKALMTTAAGLAVAIPVALIHSVFERRVEAEANHMADDLQRLFTNEKLLAGSENIAHKAAAHKVPA